MLDNLRSGLLIGQNNFIWIRGNENPSEDLVLIQTYSDMPKRILMVPRHISIKSNSFLVFLAVLFIRWKIYFIHSLFMTVDVDIYFDNIILMLEYNVANLCL